MESLQDVLTFLVIILLIVGGGLGLLVNLMLSIGVLRDGNRLCAKGSETKFASPAVWGLAVMIGSFVAVALYWLIHHSELRRGAPKAREEQ